MIYKEYNVPSLNIQAVVKSVVFNCFKAVHVPRIENMKCCNIFKKIKLGRFISIEKRCHNRLQIHVNG